MKLLSIISQNGALLAPTPFTQMVFYVVEQMPARIKVIGVSKTAAIQRRRNKGDIQRKQNDRDA
jgi:hypothetical protein